MVETMNNTRSWTSRLYDCLAEDRIALSGWCSGATGGNGRLFDLFLVGINNEYEVSIMLSNSIRDIALSEIKHDVSE